jgi:hypothetical protein
VDNRNAIALGILLTVTHCGPDDPVDGSEDQEGKQEQNQCLAHADVEQHVSRVCRVGVLRIGMAEPACLITLA